ncbi:inositol monophosphatase family protein [Catenuloplanes atrovinosus]|uniref:Fructose-1,6-bisphosphatase/inositol monophosphatase family enzyme n=1 Tax=Catenuloplanes atrovinosus TaxID=137266 RepID=A0AAE3YPL7_9ACTN|nr:inositol monophosphatase [Catenuloplanes atrovinosus]MDR7277688.1 fructose-1,6-bisphosphatase/inositol monophosphatase family enzyme [Catenuloplanes atrovinosus]
MARLHPDTAENPSTAAPAGSGPWQHELDFAITQAAAIGDLLTGARPAPATVKPDGTPVTTIDVAGNTLFSQALQARFPHDLLLAEEDTPPDYGPHPGRVWVLDPTDATWLLAAGIPLSAVSVALVVDGTPVLGVVRDPHTHRIFTAVAGGGAACNNRPLHVNQAQHLTGACLALPGGQVPALDSAGLLHAAVRAGADLVTTGSAVQDGLFVPAGLAAGYVYPYTSPWDIAALAVLTTEAGGHVTDLHGNPQRYDNHINGAIITNGALHPHLLGLVTTHLRQQTPGT